MNGFFLAAGFGTRMKEYTIHTPKPLLSIQGVRLLDYSLFLGKKWNLGSGLMNVHYHSDQINRHMDSFLDYPIQISREEKILGTGGGIAEAIRKFPDFLNDKLVVINPDTIFIPDDMKFIPTIPDNSLCHLFLLPLSQDKKYTKITLDTEQKVSFSANSSNDSYFYIGLSVFHPEFLVRVRDYSLGKWELGELWREISNEGLLTGSVFPGKAFDIGEKESYEAYNLSSQPFWDDNTKKLIARMFKKEPNL